MLARVLLMMMMVGAMRLSFMLMIVSQTQLQSVHKVYNEKRNHEMKLRLDRFGVDAASGSCSMNIQPTSAGNKRNMKIPSKFISCFDSHVLLSATFNRRKLIKFPLMLFLMGSASK